MAQLSSIKKAFDSSKELNTMQTARKGGAMPKNWQTYLALTLAVIFAVAGFSLNSGGNYNSPEPSLANGALLFILSIVMVIDAIMIEKSD